MQLVNPSGKGIVISPVKLSGPEQMAADVMMLDHAISGEDFSICFRFYKWDGIWLSLGHNQKKIPDNWWQLVKDKKINLVRRPTGGSAVLHQGGLTYSLVWKSAPKKKRQAYFSTNQWLINCFKDLGFPLQFGNNAQDPFSQNCFDLATHADLIDCYGDKRIGSAQFWKHGNLLQHGEIILDPPKELWLKLFNTKPPKPAPKIIPRENLHKLLTSSLMKYLPEISWESKSITLNDLKRIQPSSDHYLFLSDSDINPEEIIPSTNFTNEIPNG